MSREQRSGFGLMIQFLNRFVTQIIKIELAKQGVVFGRLGRHDVVGKKGAGRGRENSE